MAPLRRRDGNDYSFIPVYFPLDCFHERLTLSIRITGRFQRIVI